MQLFETSLVIKISALVRFIIIRIIFFRRVRIERISYIGRKLKLVISKGATLSINGKINIRDHVELQSKGIISIGNGCGINSFSRIIALEKIVIGDKVSIAQFVSILDHDHSYDMKNGIMDMSRYNTKPIVIGSNVWISDKVTITKGVNIGDNVVIGANSVVTKDIPSNSLAAGIPAKVIRILE